MLRFHCFPWKRYNFHRLKDIICEYSIKRMKELLSWLLYPIGCGSTMKIVYIPQIYTIWNRGNHKIWLYVLVMSRKRFRVNPHSTVAWISRTSLLEAGAKSEVSLAKWFFYELSGCGFESSCSDIEFVIRLLLTLLPYKLNIAAN